MRRHAPSAPRPRQRGVTLIELVITIVLISIAIAGVVGGFSLVVGRSADTLFQSRTTAVGQAYLDEILSRRFDRATGTGGVPPYDGTCRVQPGGGDRDNFGVVDDYDDINGESPQLASGGFGSEYSNYSVSVDVTCAGSEVGVGEDAKRIDVTVNPPQGPTMEFTAYRGNF